MGLSDYRDLLAVPNPMFRDWRPWIPNNNLLRYLTPQELQAEEMKSIRIEQVVQSIAGGDQKLRKKLMKEVAVMLAEIGFKRSMITVKTLGVILKAVFKRIYPNGLQVNVASVDRLKLLGAGNAVLYLPSHRSYMDFVLMSYVCYSYDIYIPAIAAGMDFLNMTGVGEMLRRTGAFFMRRSFANDKLYWHTFKEYIHTLMTTYHGGIEFFLEGTRSRSCKSLPPKVGLLSMALEPLFMGEVPDVTIVPVSISYDKPLEEQLFVYELLGVPKPKESTTGLFKSLKILNECFGTIYFEFGAPISVKEYLGHDLDQFRHATRPPQVQELSYDELAAISNLAHHVIGRQQDGIIVTTMSLVASVFNHAKYRDESITLPELCLQVRHLAKTVSVLGATVDTDVTEEKIQAALKLHSNILSVQNNSVELVKSTINFHAIDKGRMKGYKLSNRTMAIAVPIYSLQLYINPIMHWMVPPAIILFCAKKLCAINRVAAVDQKSLFAEWGRLRSMFACEFVFHPKTGASEYHRLLRLLAQFKLIQLESSWVSPVVDHNASALGDLIASVLPPFLTCYLLTTEAILGELSTEWVDEKLIIAVVQKHIETKLLQRDSKVHPYCLSLDSIALALQSFHFNVECLDRQRG